MSQADTNFQVGDSLMPFEIKVTPEAMKEWAIFLRDPNPIHLDPQAVKAKGLGDNVINQGPANTAYLINMLLQNFPCAQIKHLNARFVNNVFGDETVIASGTISKIEHVDNDISITCDTILTAVDRGPALTATATLCVPIA